MLLPLTHASYMASLPFHICQLLSLMMSVYFIVYEIHLNFPYRDKSIHLSLNSLFFFNNNFQPDPEVPRNEKQKFILCFYCLLHFSMKCRSVFYDVTKGTRLQTHSSATETFFFFFFFSRKLNSDLGSFDSNHFFCKAAQQSWRWNVKVTQQGEYGPITEVANWRLLDAACKNLEENCHQDFFFQGEPSIYRQSTQTAASVVENCPPAGKCLKMNVCRRPWGTQRAPTTTTIPALNSLLHLTPNICLLLWRPPSTCRRSFHTCHKFFSRGDKLYDAATLPLSCASICAAPPLTRETRLTAFVSLNIAQI